MDDDYEEDVVLENSELGKYIQKYLDEIERQGQDHDQEEKTKLPVVQVLDVQEVKGVKEMPQLSVIQSIFTFITFDKLRNHLSNHLLFEEFQDLLTIYEDISNDFPTCIEIKKNLELLRYVQGLDDNVYNKRLPLYSDLFLHLYRVYRKCLFFQVTRKQILMILKEYCLLTKYFLGSLREITDDIDILIFTTSESCTMLNENFKIVSNFITEKLIELHGIKHLKKFAQDRSIVISDFDHSNYNEDFKYNSIEKILNFGEFVLGQIIEYTFWIILTSGDQKLNNEMCTPIFTSIYDKFSNQKKNLAEIWSDYNIFAQKLLNEDSKEKYLLNRIPKKLRFTNEYNTLQNTQMISRRCQLIHHLTTEIEENLFLLIENQNNENLKKYYNKQIFNLRIQLESEYNSFNHEIKLEFRLIDKKLLKSFMNKEDIKYEKKGNCTSSTTNPNEEQILQDKNEHTPCEKETFEILSEQHDEDINFKTDISKADEFFELHINNDIKQQQQEYCNSSDENEEEDHDTKLVLLDQLREVLKPRRACMVDREKEAYKRAYGKELESEEKTEVCPTSSNHEKSLNQKQKIILKKRSNMYRNSFNKYENNQQDYNLSESESEEDQEFQPNQNLASSTLFPKSDFMRELRNSLVRQSNNDDIIIDDTVGDGNDSSSS